MLIKLFGFNSLRESCPYDFQISNKVDKNFVYNNHTFNERDKSGYSYLAVLINEEELLKAT